MQKNSVCRLAAILFLYGLNSLLNTTAAAKSDIPKSHLSQLGAAGVVKEVCSAVFISGRDAREFLAHSSKFWMMPEDKASIEDVAIDRDKKTATLRLGNGTEATAIYTGSQGCVGLAPGRDKITFTPVSAPTLLPAADELDWPMGDRRIGRSLPKGIDRKGVERAIELAFAPDAHTAAFLVLYKGKIVAERYADGITATTPLPGWSMTKTLQATLVGLLENEGRLDLYRTGIVPEWTGANDPRRKITLADLLRMSAGLDCELDGNNFNYTSWLESGYTDYLYSFVGPENAFDYAVKRLLRENPSERGHYTNCQPHVIGRVLTNELAKTGDTLAKWPRKALYDRIGMRSMVIEPDRVGNPLTAAYSYATTRDWARLGLLYAQDGIWNGERLLSHEYMALVRAPAPAWREPVYGGQVWTYFRSSGPWPSDAYSMVGIEGQRVVVIPSLDVVVVRLGHGIGDDPTKDDNGEKRPARRALSEAAQTLIASIKTETDPIAKAVTADVERFFEALRQKDLSMLKSVVTDDFVLFEDGRHWSAEKLIDVLKSRPDTTRDWIISQPNIEVSKNLTVIRYRNTGIFKNDKRRDTHEWTESATFRKENGTWKMSFLHSTLIDN
ncbi:MAG: serine hydrolase [Pseudomonadota bacterium]